MTAEFAVALPALVLAVLAALAAIAIAAAQLRCQDAAAVGARLAARGETEATVRAAAVDAGPAGAEADVVRAADDVTVTVRAAVVLPWVGLRIPAITVTDSFTVPAEPGS